MQNKAETEEPQATEADTKVAENNAQKQSLTSQITEKQDESKSLKDLVKKATVKSSESTSKGEKLTKKADFWQIVCNLFANIQKSCKQIKKMRKVS